MTVDQNSSAPCCLILFTRYPEPGKTKTRLIPAIGAEKAALLQKKLTEKLLASFDEAQGHGLDVSLLISYCGADEDVMRRWLGVGTYCQQCEGDLGARMTGSFMAAEELGAVKMFLVGSDIPGIDGALMQQAFALLAEAEVVIGPSEDGGFYGVGFTSESAGTLLPSLFENMIWSTGAVLDTVLLRLREKGCEPKLLPTLPDIDTPADLEKFDMLRLLS